MLQPVSQIEMLDRHFIFAEIVVTFPEREMKIRLLVIGEFAFLQHPFHLSEERTIRLGQLLDVDELGICVDLPAVESKRHVGKWGCLMEPAQLHQDGAQQAVGITVARSEIDRAPHQLLGDSRLFLLQQDFRLANESEWGVGPCDSGAPEALEGFCATAFAQQQIAQFGVRFGEVWIDASGLAKRGNCFGGTLLLERESSVVMSNGQIRVDINGLGDVHLRKANEPKIIVCGGAFRLYVYCLFQRGNGLRIATLESQKFGELNMAVD